MDVKIAFLSGDLHKELYIDQHEEFVVLEKNKASKPNNLYMV